MAGIVLNIHCCGHHKYAGWQRSPVVNALSARARLAKCIFYAFRAYTGPGARKPTVGEGIESSQPLGCSAIT